MPATVIAERIGWTSSMPVLRDRVAELRPLFVPPEPVSGRPTSRASWPSGTCGSPTTRSPSATARRPGCRCSSGSGYSRFIGAWMIPTRQAHDVFGGHLACSDSSGRCPAGWCGTGSGDRAVARRQAGVHRRVPVVPGHARGWGRRCASRRPRSARVSSSGPTATWRRASCRAAGSSRCRLQRPAHRLAAKGQRAGPRHLRSVRRAHRSRTAAR